MIGKALPGEGDKDRIEEGKLLLGEKEIIRVEPKEVEPVKKEVSPAAKLEKPIEVFPKETRMKGGRTAVPGNLSGPKSRRSPEVERKGNPFFKCILILSFVFTAVAIGLLLLPIFNISIPHFLTPIIRLVSSK